MAIDRYEMFSKMVDDLGSVVDSQIDNDNNKIDVSGQVIADALKTQLPLQLTWEEIYRETCYLVNELEDEAEHMFSIAYKELSADSYKALSATECKQYALSDSDFVDTRRLLNKAKLIKGRAEGVLEAIKTRRFILKNLCDVLVSEQTNYII